MALSPIQRSDRIQLLDVLRGFAIFGILLMNMEAYTLYWMISDEQKAGLPFAEYAHTTEFILYMFAEGKFYSIFSMLFGIGFAIYLSKADSNPLVLKTFRRRLFFLLIIGFIHLMIWTGDIVMFYALIGFVLILFRKFSNRTLLILSAFCILIPIGLYAIKMAYPAFDVSGKIYATGESYSAKIGVTSLKELHNAMLDDNFWNFLKINFTGIFFRYGDLVFQDRFFKVFGMFLLGLVIGRTRFYNNIQAKKPILRKVLIAGLVIGLPANYFMAQMKFLPGYYQLNTQGLWQTIAYAFGVVPLALAYAAGIALLYNGGFKKILNILTPVGKMALSNYILQTLAGIFIFTGLGIAYPTIGPLPGVILTICIFCSQILISYVWLRFFNYGPLEWLWRSATYGQIQPMRKKNVLPL